MTSLAKWLSVGLLTKWLWIRITLLSLKLQIWRLLRARSSLTFRQTIECGFTLKIVRDIIIAYIIMHCRDKYSQHSWIIWLVWLNGWVFLYELSGCGFESCCCHLIWEVFLYVINCSCNSRKFSYKLDFMLFFLS